MKRLIFAGGAGLALVGGALAGPLTGYTNSGTFTSTSPSFQIDATNVVNTGVMGLGISGFSAGQFDFSDVLTYTNRGVMYCDNGFLFNNSPATTGSIQPSVNFFNQNPGQIYGGALVLQTGANLIGLGAGSAPQIIISATNITSSGVLQVGQAGRISATGDALNLSHGAMIVEGFDQASSGAITGGVDLGPGEFIQYWGGGLQSNNFFYGNLAVPGTASSAINSRVTFNDHTTGTASFSISGLTVANAIAMTNSLNASNFTTQVIIFADTVGEVNMNAFFLPPGTTPISTNNFSTAVVKWGVSVTNIFGQVLSNTLYLTDDLGSLTTNGTFVTNNTTLHGLTEQVPTNYMMTTAFNERNFLPGNTTYSQTLFTNGFGTNGTGSGEISNVYSAFSVNLAPVTAEPDPLVAGSTFSNVPARIEITANKSLDLTGSIVNAGNYLNLSSTNHYAGSQGAQVTFPFADITLGSTNGQMTISNLVPAYLTRFNGPIQAWSGAWTNLTSATNIVSNGTNAPTTNTFTVTNAFMVTMVVSSLDPFSLPTVENLSLRSTNVVISDAITVESSLLINAQNLTITSNAAGNLTPVGQLIFDPLLAYDFYSAFVPTMQNFTNYGLFETENAAFLQFRQNPNNPTAGDGPWQSVVNRGELFTVGGLNIWANYFENTAPPVVNPAIAPSIEAEFGDIIVVSSTVLITNSPIAALQGDMSITSGTVTIANESLQATGFLDFAATNLLTDLVPAGTGAVAAGNNWSSGDGFSLTVAPTFLSGLLGTSVTSVCRTNAVCENYWAGVPVAFSTNVAATPLPTMANNVPIGQLILDGGNNNSVFHFQGPNQDTVNPYAMYVDQIELADGATNTNSAGRYTTFNIDPNVTIYFLKANIGAADISRPLAETGGGRLVWLNNNVGHFSATKVTYSDGQTFTVNSSYVQAYGLPPEPPVPLTPQNIQLQIKTANVGSTPMAAISWYAQAHSTNTLYYRTMTNPNWQVRTNFVQGATAGRVTNFDSVGASHLYKVSVGQ
jgi:hypothetical protein